MVQTPTCLCSKGSPYHVIGGIVFRRLGRLGGGGAVGRHGGELSETKYRQQEMEQIKAWERPSDAPGAASFAVRDAVAHSVLAGSVHPPFSVQDRQKTQQKKSGFTPRTDVVKQGINL